MCYKTSLLVLACRQPWNTSNLVLELKLKYIYLNELQKILKVINNVRTVPQSQNDVEPCTLPVFLCVWEKNMRNRITCMSFPYCSLTSFGKWVKGSIQRFPLVDWFSLICLTKVGIHFYFSFLQSSVKNNAIMDSMKSTCFCLFNYAPWGTSRGSICVRSHVIYVLEIMKTHSLFIVLMILYIFVHPHPPLVSLFQIEELWCV